MRTRTSYIGKYFNTFLFDVDLRSIVILGPENGEELIHLRGKFPKAKLTAVESKVTPELKMVAEATGAEIVKVENNNSYYFPFGVENLTTRFEDFPDLIIARNIPASDSVGINTTLALFGRSLIFQDKRKRILASVAYKVERDCLANEVFDSTTMAFVETEYDGGIPTLIPKGEFSTTDRYVFITGN